MPQITAMLLGRAISDVLNPAHGDWNKAFRVERKQGDASTNH